MHLGVNTNVPKELLIFAIPISNLASMISQVVDIVKGNREKCYDVVSYQSDNIDIIIL